MSIFIYGMKCSLCNEPIEHEQEIISFPPFVSNKNEPIYMFSDATFHSKCFYHHTLANKAIKHLEDLREKTGPGKRVCKICNEQVKSADEYLGLGYLTDDMNTQLFEYNYSHYHRKCLKQWAKLSELYDLLNKLQESGIWGGEGLNKLLYDIRKLKDL